MTVIRIPKVKPIACHGEKNEPACGIFEHDASRDAQGP